MFYLVANWKAHMSWNAAHEWITSFDNELLRYKEVKNACERNLITFIIAPSYPFLSLLIPYVQKTKNVLLASQDVSKFKMGSYTGEVTASAFPPEVTYSIIGHVERRKYFQETNEDIGLKASHLFEKSIKPIVCVRNVSDLIPKESFMVAYEPESSVGRDYDEPLSNILLIKKELRLSTHQLFIYGGNVNKNTIKGYASSGEINGFLVGRASQNPSEFIELARQLPL